jgi:hypothetical protein
MVSGELLDTQYAMREYDSISVGLGWGQKLVKRIRINTRWDIRSGMMPLAIGAAEYSIYKSNFTRRYGGQITFPNTKC